MSTEPQAEPSALPQAAPPRAEPAPRSEPAAAPPSRGPGWSLYVGLAMLLFIAFYAGRPFDSRGGLQTAADAESTGDYQGVSFQVLGSFDYVPKPGGAHPRLPPEVSRLDKEKVAVRGFMVPVDMDKDGVSSFVLVKDQMMCCYGATPKMNQWIFVQLSRKMPVMMDQPITVCGTMSVGEDIQDGEVLSLYRLDGDRIDLPH